nr:hypothetical protein [Mycobacterium leprae]
MRSDRPNSNCLKLLSADAASFSEAMGATENFIEVVINDAVNWTYTKLVLSDVAKNLLDANLGRRCFIVRGCCALWSLPGQLGDLLELTAPA